MTSISARPRSLPTWREPSAHHFRHPHRGADSQAWCWRRTLYGRLLRQLEVERPYSSHRDGGVRGGYGLCVRPMDRRQRGFSQFHGRSDSTYRGFSGSGVVERITGIADGARVTSESFKRWVLEDVFPAGRPAWEEVGVELRSDVAAFEAIKGRLINASHMLMSYPAALDRLSSGCPRRRATLSLPNFWSTLWRLTPHPW